MKFISLNQVAPYTDDFFFTSLTDTKIRDAIVVCNPSDAVCMAPTYLRSRRTLEEHIQYINEHQVKKALIVADDIQFIRQCPTLEYLYVIPSFTAQDFDFSPLYDLPNIRWLDCQTVYGIDENKVSNVDYSQIRGIRCLNCSGDKGHQNVSSVYGLKTLYFAEGQPSSESLYGTFEGSTLQKLSLCQSSVCSLDGLNSAANLRILDLAYNRRLQDISALSAVGDTLISLSIENCGKIKDFSSLYQLPNLERLVLRGSNVLPDLGFIRNMPNLKEFIFFMDVADGALSHCLSIPYVEIKNRKHYSHNNSMFSKAFDSTLFFHTYNECE